MVHYRERRTTRTRHGWPCILEVPRMYAFARHRPRFTTWVKTIFPIFLLCNWLLIQIFEVQITMALFQSDFLKNSFNFKIHVNSDFWFTNVRRKHQLSELSAIPSKFLISATELTETSYSINSTCLRRVRRCVKRGKKIRWIYFTRKMSVFKKNSSNQGLVNNHSRFLGGCWQRLFA